MSEGLNKNHSEKSAYDAMVEQFGEEGIDPESMDTFIKRYQNRSELSATEHSELNVKKHALEDFSARLKEKGENVPGYITVSLDKIHELLNGVVVEEVEAKAA